MEKACLQIGICWTCLCKFASFASPLLYTFPFLLCRAAFADDKWCTSENFSVHVDHDLTMILRCSITQAPFIFSRGHPEMTIVKSSPEPRRSQDPVTPLGAPEISGGPDPCCESRVKGQDMTTASVLYEGIESSLDYGHHKVEAIDPIVFALHLAYFWMNQPIISVSENGVLKK